MTEKLTHANKYIAENKGTVNARYRNKYHAMPPIGWMNDPNGFIYAFGKYHLFYQFHPYSPVWGPMHWGHFTSEDLITWKEEPVALAPDMPYDEEGCFSGTALVKDGKLYLMYTSVRGDFQTQALAVSEDGIHFEKLGQVIPTEQIPEGSSKTDFRDPKVFERNGVYYCMIGSSSADGAGQVLMYRSADLFDWSYVGVVHRDERTDLCCECPDYFTLDGTEVLLTHPQNVHAENIKYQNKDANVYMLGSLDTESGKFKAASEGELDSGFDFYAAQTLLDPDGRRIMIAWQSMWDRTNVTAEDGWAGVMTLPRELTIRNGRIYQQPVREIESYRCERHHTVTRSLNGTFSLPDCGKTQEIIVTFSVEKAQKVGVKIFCGTEHETLIYYDKKLECVVFDRSKMGMTIKHSGSEQSSYVRVGKVGLEDGTITMRLLIDTSCCEVFFNGGECVMSANIYPDEGDCNNILFSEDGTANILRLDVYSLDTDNGIKE